MLPKLTFLTMYRNPIALHPFYRSQIIKATLRGVDASRATLRVLDHFALSLEEILGDVAQERGYRFGRLLVHSAKTCVSRRQRRSRGSLSTRKR